MPIVDLVELFTRSVAPLGSPAGGLLAGVPLAASSRHRLAKDSTESPCFLVGHEKCEGALAPIRLENLNVTFGVNCTIESGTGSTESGIFTIIRCLKGKPYLEPHFLRAMAPIAASLGNSPSIKDVQRAVGTIVELFRALTAPSRKAIQGLWAELFVMASSSDLDAMTSAWHSASSERFDFAAAGQRLEVKSNSQRQRKHHFSAEQLAATKGIDIVIASLFVERSGGGLTLQDLFDDIRQRLWPNIDAVRRFDSVFYGVLGNGCAEWMDEGFDGELARNSLVFYDSESVPRIENHDPERITEIRFCSELEQIANLHSDDLVRRGGLYAATVMR